VINNLTIVIPFRNGHATIGRLLDSLPVGVHAIVVDDMSDTPPDVVGRARAIRLDKRSYFSGAVNAGLAACTTDVLVLNQDVTLSGPAIFTDLEAWRGTYAMIGDAVMTHPAWPNGYVQGTCMFLRRDAIQAVGAFNERDWPLWGATAEYQARLCRAGFKALPVDLDGAAWFTHERNGKYGSAIAEFVREDPEHADWAKRTPPMVSVIMACYNYGRYLPDAINSLRGGMTSIGAHPGQTFAGWECIIVDDCSSDETPAIAQGLADSWQGIHYIRLAKNQGTASAYNAGIKASHGRFFMVLSADDMLQPAALETMYRVVEDDPGAMVYTDMQIFRDGQLDKVWQMKDYDFETLLDRNHVPSGIMASKKAWHDVGGYPSMFRWGREDWAMAVALGRAGYCGVRIPEPLYLYRRAGQNRSAHNQTAEWRTHFVTQMRETFPDLYEGERPMGCCGGSRRLVRTAQRGPVAQTRGAVAMRTGETGMVMLEYIGSNIGKETYWGPVTNTRYEFGGSKRVGYVDNRDADAMLSLVQGRRPVFKVYAAPKPVEPAVKVVVAPVAKVAAAPVPDDIDAAATAIAAAAGRPELAPALSAMGKAMPESPVVAEAVAYAKAKRTRKPKNV
jgi:GT2 family glycosyltransferase